MAHLMITSLTLAVILATVHAVQWAGEKSPYRLGDAVAVTYLNRSIETGEHITDASGQLQYIPFPTCAETKQPLSFTYLLSRPQNCTITLTDELFHLIEFYIHNDAPMTCRMPAMHASHGRAMSPGGIAPSKKKEAESQEQQHGAGSAALNGEADFVPLVIGLAGELQRSHLHIANKLNVIIHTGPPSSLRTDSHTGKPKKPPSRRAIGAVDSASAYSVSPQTTNTRIVIGDELTFVFAVTWFVGSTLTATSSDSGSSWFFWMFFGSVIGFGSCYASIKGVAVPASVEQFVVGKREVLPKYNGYGYGIGTGGTNGFQGTRKGD